MDNGISHRSQTDTRGTGPALDRGALEGIAEGSSINPPISRREAQTLRRPHYSRALRVATEILPPINGPLVAPFRHRLAGPKYHECVVSHVRCHNL